MGSLSVTKTAKKWMIFVIVILLVFCAFLYIVAQPNVPSRKITITAVDSDIEGLDLEVFLVQSEDGAEYTFEIKVTNNSAQNLLEGETNCYYKKGDNWRKLQSKVKEELLDAWGILCPETIANAGAEEAASTYTMSITFPEEYEVSRNGEYKLVFSLRTWDNEEAGSAWIAWTQE